MEIYADVCLCAAAAATGKQNGMNIYGPFEAGFSSTMQPPGGICTSTTASYFCAGGMDIETCIGELTYTCGSATDSKLVAAQSSGTFGDGCNLHASPYHAHAEPNCTYR